MAEPGRKTHKYDELYLQRILPQWNTPGWLNGDVWRSIVRRQMLAMICRDTLITQVLQLRWEIRATDPAEGPSRRSEIDHYVEIFRKGDGDGFDVTVDSLLQDVLDIPFGGALEAVRDETGELHQIVNVDGATLYPTYDEEFPVVQQITTSPMDVVTLKADEINRIYLSPRTSIRRKGWGMAPPERIFLALVLVGRGDRYYANLLLDTPPSGILDLIDMSEESAVEWVGSYRELLVGPEYFKIPVLYEHEAPAVFIPFTQSPSELMFPTTVLQYMSLTCAGYGMTVSDLGLTDPQRTLAGSIREERRSRRLMVGLLARKLTALFNRILPSYLSFMFVRDDEETMVALGRSRLTHARAMVEMIKGGMLSAEEALEQLVTDGLVTIHLEVEDRPEPLGVPTGQRPPQEHHLIGKPVPPSEGGHGEIKSDTGRQGPT